MNIIQNHRFHQATTRLIEKMNVKQTLQNVLATSSFRPNLLDVKRGEYTLRFSVGYNHDFRYDWELSDSNGLLMNVMLCADGKVSNLYDAKEGQFVPPSEMTPVYLDQFAEIIEEQFLT